MLKFEENVLKQDLGRLHPRSRVAFAASCAQRLSDAYRRFLANSGRTDRADFCDEAINYAWNHILLLPEKATADRLVAEVMALIPDEDAPGWTPWTASGDDALSALAYCLRCLQSLDPQDAAWAARRVYEALDYFVTTRDSISPSDPGMEIVILSDPAIQAEFERQARDKGDLISAGDFLTQQLLDNLRQRSTKQQAIPAG